MHQELASGRWSDLSLSAQMGNIGSEVGRALRAQKKQSITRQDKALDRMFELLDLTIDDHQQDVGLRELTRTREVLADYFFGNNIYRSTPENLDKYFLQFAIAARAQK